MQSKFSCLCWWWFFAVIVLLLARTILYWIVVDCEHSIGADFISSLVILQLVAITNNKTGFSQCEHTHEYNTSYITQGLQNNSVAKMVGYIYIKCRIFSDLLCLRDLPLSFITDLQIGLNGYFYFILFFLLEEMSFGMLLLRIFLNLLYTLLYR